MSDTESPIAVKRGRGSLARKLLSECGACWVLQVALLSRETFLPPSNNLSCIEGDRRFSPLEPFILPMALVTMIAEAFVGCKPSFAKDVLSLSF
jgi:hypothetical protein